MTNPNDEVELHEDYLPAVPFVPFRCPSCKAHKPRTYSVRKQPRGGRTTRYHRCQACGQVYRSFELTPETMHDWTMPKPGVP